MAATCEATAKLLHQRKRSSTCGKQPSSQEPTRLSHKLRALLELRDGASGTRRAMEGGEGREGEEDQAKPGRSAGELESLFLTSGTEMDGSSSFLSF